MIGTVRQQGADTFANNSSGINYLPTVQATTGRRSKLFKVVVSNIGGSPVYIWINDYATGSGFSNNPMMVVLCPTGVCTTLDFGDGRPFANGILVQLATNMPTNTTTTATLAANNAAIVDVSFRLE